MKKTVWIARTAVCLALLIAIQFLTKSLGQLVTGSCVNLVLAIAALIGGVWSGVTVAVISPFCAYLLGIGPAFLPLVPCVSLGNAVYAVLFALLVGGFLQKKRLPAAYGSMVLAAAVSHPCPAGGPGCHPGSEAQHRHSGFYLAAASHSRDRRRAGLPDRAGPLPRA